MQKQMQDAAQQFLDGLLTGKEFLYKLIDAIAKEFENEKSQDIISLAHLLSKGDQP